MRDYILKRLGLMIVTAILIIFLVFVFIKLLPDYQEAVLGSNPANAEWIKQREGYDKPILEQFWIWVTNILGHGEFGWSVTKNQDAAAVLKERIPVTVRINIIPYLISIPIGFALGIWSALKKNKFTDHAISLGVVFFISVPGFVVATLLQYFLGYKWNILPPMLASSVEVQANPALAITSMILPTLALTFGSVAGLTRVTRAELTEVLTSEFMLLCRTKGLTRKQATIRHALRNSMVPLAPSIIGGFVSILSGSLIIERIFRVPGIGGVFLEAISGRDYPLVMTVMMFYTVIGLLTTLVIDLSYGIIDPRIRMGGGKR